MRIKHMKRTISFLLSASLTAGIWISGMAAENTTGVMENRQGSSADTLVVTAASSDKASIEDALNLANISPEWTYSEEADAWTMGIVTAVANAELPDYQGVSVCVPGAYVEGVDTDGDGIADVTGGTAAGNLVIDDESSVTSTNGQIYAG